MEVAVQKAASELLFSAKRRDCMLYSDDTVLSIENTSGLSTAKWQRGKENNDMQGEYKTGNNYQRRKKKSKTYAN